MQPVPHEGRRWTASSQSREQWDAWEMGAVARLAEGLTFARKSAKLSQRSLADESGIDRGQIANIENARISELPRLGVLIKLAAVLDIPPVSLIYPGLPDKETEFLPGRNMSALRALYFFTGEVMAPFQVDPMPKPLEILYLSRRRERMLGSQQRWKNLLLEEPGSEELQRMIDELSETLTDTERRLEELGAELTGRAEYFRSVSTN